MDGKETDLDSPACFLLFLQMVGEGKKCICEYVMDLCAVRSHHGLLSARHHKFHGKSGCCQHGIPQVT